MVNMATLAILFFLIDLFYRKVILVPLHLRIRHRLEQLGDRLFWLGKKHVDNEHFRVACDTLRQQVKCEAVITQYLSIRLWFFAFVLRYNEPKNNTDFVEVITPACQQSDEFRKICQERRSLIRKCCKWNTPFLYLFGKAFYLLYKILFHEKSRNFFDSFIDKVRLSMDIINASPPKSWLGTMRSNAMRFFF